MATNKKFRVTLPGPHKGTEVYYGVVFVNGVADDVPEGFALSEFHDWREVVIEETGASAKASAAAEAKAAEEALKKVAAANAASSENVATAAKKRESGKKAGGKKAATPATEALAPAEDTKAE